MGIQLKILHRENRKQMAQKTLLSKITYRLRSSNCKSRNFKNAINVNNKKNLSTPTETIMEKLSKFEQKHNLIYSLSVLRAQKVPHSKLNKTT